MLNGQAPFERAPQMLKNTYALFFNSERKGPINMDQTQNASCCGVGLHGNEGTRLQNFDPMRDGCSPTHIQKNALPFWQEAVHW